MNSTLDRREWTIKPALTGGTVPICLPYNMHFTRVNTGLLTSSATWRHSMARLSLCQAEAWEEFKQELLCQDLTYFLCVNVAINGRLTRSFAFFFDYVSAEWRLNTRILQWRYLHKCLTVVHDQHKACVLYIQYYGLFIQSIWKVFCVNIVWLVYRSHPSKNIR